MRVLGLMLLAAALGLAGCVTDEFSDNPDQGSTPAAANPVLPSPSA